MPLTPIFEVVGSERDPLPPEISPLVPYGPSHAQLPPEPPSGTYENAIKEPLSLPLPCEPIFIEKSMPPSPGFPGTTNHVVSRLHLLQSNPILSLYDGSPSPPVASERPVVPCVGVICPTTGYTLGPGTVAPIAAVAVIGEPNLRKFLFLQITTINIIPTIMTSKVGMDAPIPFLATQAIVWKSELIIYHYSRRLFHYSLHQVDVLFDLLLLL